MHATRWLLYILLALLLVLLLGAALAAWLMLQSQPLAHATGAAQNDSVNQLDLMQLGRITPESTLLLEISEAELNQLVQQKIAQVSAAVEARASIQITPGVAQVDFSGALPLAIDRRYLNVRSRYSVGDSPAQISLTDLQVGKLRIPNGLQSLLLPYALSHCRADNDCNAALAAYKNVTQLELNEGALRLQYALEPGGLSAEGQQDLASEVSRLTPYLQELAAMALERQGERLSLHAAMRHAFSLAQRQSVRSNDAVAENRSALLALAAMGADPRVLDLLNMSALREQTEQFGSLYLRGRKDLAQHFLTSAALYLLGGSELSEYLGVYKELDDVDKGKPFGVGDLVADRVGIRLAQHATESKPSALRIQSQLITAASADAYLLTDATLMQLEARYQGANGIDVPELTERIDKLLAELPLLQQ